MNFEEFQKLDPELAHKLIENAKEIRSISEWQQKLRDSLVDSLRKRGCDELGYPEYVDKNQTMFMSLVDEAMLVGDAAMKRKAAHLEDSRKRFEPSREERENIYDVILKKHGLTVGIVVGEGNSLEDQFCFEQDP